MACCTEEKTQIAIKKDWYQSGTHVILAILGKHSSKEDCSIKFDVDEITIQAKFVTGYSYNLNLKLSKNIIPERSSFRLLSSKLEILLAKSDARRWDVLERVIDSKECTSLARNWDKLVNDLTKDDGDDGDDGDVDTLIKKIYSDGSDEVRKAMNKSFMESGGTVLSTDWKNVSKGKVEKKPIEEGIFFSWRKNGTNTKIN